MRVQRVVTNETCNQNCWFCNARRAAEQPEFVARPAVRRRILEARAGDTQEIWLTGGEPTLRSDLADLVRRAAEGGKRVVLETNAALIDEPRAQSLVAAGLCAARVQLVAWGPAADAITRDPGGFDAAIRGIRALAAAGVSVEVTTPIVRRNASLVVALPGEIAAAALPVTGLVLVVPTAAPDPRECAPLEDVAAAVTAIADSARGLGFAVRFDQATFVPPCIFPKPERVAHLFALNRGYASLPGFARVDACGACVVSDRCPGFPEAARSSPLSKTVRPIVAHRVRRRLTVLSSIAEQVAREAVGRDVLRSSVYGAVPEYTVRVNFHCNQGCEFCFVSTHLPPAAEETVRAAIAAAGRERAVLVLSGGEPTLNPNLCEYVRLAKRLGVRCVELQSNAIRLADAALTRELVDAGVDRAMISLHGSTAEISDAITGAPGTWAATVRGLDRLAEADLPVRLNFVFCRTNYLDFPRYVDFVAARWPRVGIVFSFVAAHTDVVPRTPDLIPRFSDVLPPLLVGLERARAAGIEVSGFDSMCGLPLCLVPESERGGFSRLPATTDSSVGEFVKGEACVGCVENYRCYGVRRGYAELYGTGELCRQSAAPAATEAQDGCSP